MPSQFSTVSRKGTSSSQGFYSKKDPCGSCLGHLLTPQTNSRCWVMGYCAGPSRAIRMNKEPEWRTPRTTQSVIKGDIATQNGAGRWTGLKAVSHPGLFNLEVDVFDILSGASVLMRGLQAWGPALDNIECRHLGCAGFRICLFSSVLSS